MSYHALGHPEQKSRMGFCKTVLIIAMFGVLVALYAFGFYYWVQSIEGGASLLSATVQFTHLVLGTGLGTLLTIRIAEGHCELILPLARLSFHDEEKAFNAFHECEFCMKIGHHGFHDLIDFEEESVSQQEKL